MQKSSNPGRLWAAGILAGILVLAGCADVVTEPQARGGNREGRVTITIDTGTRTVLPSEVRFSRFEIRIVEQGGTQELEPVEASGGTVELVLPVGSWNVTVGAYNQAQPPVLVARASNILTNTKGQISGSSRFVLEPTGTETGVLAYRITIPPGLVLDQTHSRIQIEQNGTAVKTIELSTSVEGETSLEPGRYTLEVEVEEATSGKRGGRRETVVIFPGLTTEVEFTPEGLGEPVDTLTFNSLGEYRAMMETLPANTKDTPYRIKLRGIALEALWEGHDPLGQVVSAQGGRYIALDLSGCTGTAIGSLDALNHIEFVGGPHPRPIGGTSDAGSIDSNLGNRGRVVSLMLPESLESIGDFAFYRFSSLESVVLPEPLKVIGHEAFFYTGLTSVEIPDSVERMGIGAFRGGTLKSVKLPASLKEIPIRAFAAQDFSSIELPQGLEVIGAYAFSTTLLRSISFPDSLTTIEDGAFNYTYDLKSTITLPPSLTTLKEAFYLSGITAVDMSACVALETIGDYAFYECSSLTEVTLPPNIKRIEHSFFRDCSSLEVIDLPATVEYIGYRALDSASTLLVRSIKPPQVDMYDDFPLSASVIYVPDESLQEYKTAIGWSKYAERLCGLSAYPG